MNIQELNAKLAKDLPNYRLVFGNGNLNSKVLFIGEAPGKNEVEQGKCFVGSAGKNLESFLSILDLSREDIYITNAVKFRPTKLGKVGEINRPPTKSEINLFKEYLFEEIEIISPKLIVTLGATPLSVFVNEDFKMGDYAGLIYNDFRTPIFPLYHPASIIYNQALKGDYEEHLVLLKDYLKSM